MRKRSGLWGRETLGFGFLAILFLIIGCSSGSKSMKNLSRTERARILVEIANGALVEGDATGALEHLVRAEEEDPNLPELHHSKGLAFYAKHDLASAIQSVRRSIEIKPNYANANNTLGKLLIDQGHYPEAIGLLLRAAKDPLYRESYKAWTNLGILEYRQNKYFDAESYMDKAIRDAPAQACVAYYYRGHIKLKGMRLSEAIRDYDQATKKLCSQFGDAQLALGTAYQKNQQYHEARKTFLEIQKRYPNTKWAKQALDQLKYLP